MSPFDSPTAAWIRWMCHRVALAHAVVALCACDCSADRASPIREPTTAGASTLLLDVTGTLTAGGTGARNADHDVVVVGGSQLTIELTSEAFDPVLDARPPGSGSLTNDDWEGSHREARLSFIAPEAGVLKVAVTSYQPGAAGPYRLKIWGADGQGGATTPASVVAVGESREGEIDESDEPLADGRRQHNLLVQGAGDAPVRLRIEATAAVVPIAVVMSPSGQAIVPDEPSSAGLGTYTLSEAGVHRLQLLTPVPGVFARYRLSLSAVAANAGPAQPSLARAHHRLPSVAPTAALAMGQLVNAHIDDEDARLPSGESADVYALAGRADELVRIELSSEAFDAYLMVIGPSGRLWENDDAGGTRDAVVELTWPATGSYRVVATTFAAAESGPYDLKVSSGARVLGRASSPSPASAMAAADVRRGALEDGDAVLPTGEWYDTHVLQLRQGEHVHLKLTSSAFDTYLIVEPPGDADSQENDDGGDGTHAELDFVAAEQQQQGAHRVLVTSYEPGERGAYELRVMRGSAHDETPTAGASADARPAVGSEVHGRLRASDPTLDEGELTNVYTREFQVGEPVAIRLASSVFDPYLIVETPSGHQIDNDDLDAATRDAGVDLPAAEAGIYRLTVTSYRPAETGAYTLRFDRGEAVPRPGGEGGRVFGLFIGISDYPDGVGDLPQCANDAKKLAETLRSNGLLDADHQVVLTDGQATQSAVRSAMARLARVMGPDDLFVFFYSGHGGQGDPQQSRDRREIDRTDEHLVLYDEQMSDDELARLFEPVRVRLAVAAIDACFSGGFAKDLITRPGRIGLFSSEEDVLSAVAEQFQAGGYLSHFLREGLAGQADAGPRDQVLTVGELTHYLYTQFGRHATDVQLQGAYQHLVIDRGAVRVDQVLWSYR